MATSLWRCTLKRIIRSSGSNLLRIETISASNRTNWSSISSIPGEAQSSDFTFAVFGAQNGSTLFPRALRIHKFSTTASKDVSTEPKAEKKGKKPTKPKPELSDCDKICEMLKGDGDLDGLESSLEQCGVKMNLQLMTEVINVSHDAGRKVLRFYKWAIKQPGCKPNGEVFNAVINLFGRRKDFKAVETLLVENASGDGVEIDLKTFGIVVDRLVQAGREKQTVVFFKRMEEYGFKQDEAALKITVSALCEKGFASYAENLVKHLADTYFPDEYICNTLVKGWCIAGKLDEARRMVNEMSTGGFAMGVMGYNALLDCVCKLCRQKDPFRLLSEATNVLVDMEAAGAPRNESTFNILITHLCKIRKTEDAYKLFSKMEEYGCAPNLTTYVVLIRSLFLAARVADGHEMLNKMTESGFNAGVKDYFSFIKVLCGIERLDDALKVFNTMQKNGCDPGSEMFELLITKLCRVGRVGKARRFWHGAGKRGLSLSIDPDMFDQSNVQMPMKKKKKEKPKRESFSMILQKKKKRLKKIRLSFVKKPKSLMRLGH